MNQKGEILRHLLNYGTITSYEAFKCYSILRLSAIIFDLKQLGHDIKGCWIQNGEKRYYEYRLVKGSGGTNATTR